jgi:hypothetical protein
MDTGLPDVLIGTENTIPVEVVSAIVTPGKFKLGSKE